MCFKDLVLVSMEEELIEQLNIHKTLRSVDLLRTNFGQQYIGNHIILNASDTILA
jgi:hypothetical protein